MTYLLLWVSILFLLGELSASTEGGLVRKGEKDLESGETRRKFSRTAARLLSVGLFV